jgi:hypothetical protein
LLKVIYQSRAKKFLKKIVEKPLKVEFLNAITEIRTDPEVGEVKKGDLLGIYGYDVMYKGINYEIAYRILEIEKEVVVNIIMVGTRENFWDEVKKYIN